MLLQANTVDGLQRLTMTAQSQTSGTNTTLLSLVEQIQENWKSDRDSWLNFSCYRTSSTEYRKLAFLSQKGHRFRTQRKTASEHKHWRAVGVFFCLKFIWYASWRSLDRFFFKSYLCLSTYHTSWAAKSEVSIFSRFALITMVPSVNCKLESVTIS